MVGTREVDKDLEVEPRKNVKNTAKWENVCYLKFLGPSDEAVWVSLEVES